MSWLNTGPIIAGALVAGLICVAPTLGVTHELNAAAALLAAVHVIWCISEARAAGSVRRQAARRASWLPHATGAAIFIAVLLAAFGATSAPTGRAIPLCGGALALGGIALRISAIRQLGPRFTDNVMLIPGHTRESGGPYAWFRHPADIGVLAITTGSALLGHAPLAALWISGVLLPLLLTRAIREDRMLQAAFGPPLVTRLEWPRRPQRPHHHA